VTNVYNTTIINNNTTNVTRINYVNQHVTNGVTAVSHETFVNARPVNANLAKVDQRQIENAPVVHNIAAQPVRQSVMGAGRPETARPPATVVNRQVVATRQPPPPRAPFGQGHLAEPNVRTEAPSQAQAARPVQPAARPTDTPRPQPPTMQANQPQHPQVPPTSSNNRPMGSPNVPHPGATQPQVPHPPVAQNGHPLVRPAPPVQENPQHQQNEQAKFNAWQQQRETTAQRPPQPHAEPHSEARAPQPAPHSEPPHK
jgi:hypothetical protein